MSIKDEFKKKIDEFKFGLNPKDMTDQELKDVIYDYVQQKNIEKACEALGYIKSQVMPIEIVIDLLEKNTISEENKVKIIEKLGYEMKLMLFLKYEQYEKNLESLETDQNKKNEKIKKCKEIKKLFIRNFPEEFKKILIYNRVSNPYKYLFDNMICDDKNIFSDLELAEILKFIEEKVPDAYNLDEAINVVARQMVGNLDNFGIIIPIHMQEVLDNIKVPEENDYRKFNINNRDDRKLLADAVIKLNSEYGKKSELNGKEKTVIEKQFERFDDSRDEI